MSSSAQKYLSILGVIAVLAVGATALTRNSNSSAATRSGVPTMQGGPQTGGQGMPGFGTPVTGTTLTKVSQAATAKYPGTVEHAMALDDGSYVVHVITSSGEVHVLVSKDFKVTGTEQGPPRGMGPQGAPPSGVVPRTGTPPTGAPQTSGSTT